jgi:hypothetical protein
LLSTGAASVRRQVTLVIAPLAGTAKASSTNAEPAAPGRTADKFVRAAS